MVPPCGPPDTIRTGAAAVPGPGVTTVAAVPDCTVSAAAADVPGPGVIRTVPAVPDCITAAVDDCCCCCCCWSGFRVVGTPVAAVAASV
jgi:hypothetical protein